MDNIRQVNVKELKANLSRELQNLPFEVTKYGRVIANMAEGGYNNGKKVVTPAENGHNCQCSKNTTTCNDEQKATSPTGGRPEYFGQAKKPKRGRFAGCLECGAMFGHRATCSKG